MKRLSEIEFVVTQNKVYVVIDGVKTESEKISEDDAKLLWADLVLSSADLKPATPEPEQSEDKEQCNARCNAPSAEIFGLVAYSRCTATKDHPVPRNGTGHYFPEAELGPTY